jgi:DNA-binding transcriptional LysR family regulator
MSEMDRLCALNVFVRAAEVRSFTDAGRQLGLSSSAVGKAVARLEDRLGVRLFHRSTRSIAVTQEGKLFFESCQRIFAEMKAVEAEFARATRAPTGKLRVSLPLAGTLTMPAVTQFMRAYPDIELDMDFTDHLVDVIDGGYDVVVRSGEVCDSRLMSRRLGTFRLVLVASPGYLARAGLPSTPSDLVGHACVHRRHPTTGKLQRWPLRAAAASAVALPTTAAASTFDPLISMAELGLGIACVPDFAIRGHIADGTLVTVLGDYIDHIEAVRALWPGSRYPSPKLRVFIDFLAEHLLPRASSMRDTTIAVAGEIARCRDVSTLAELLTMN